MSKEIKSKNPFNQETIATYQSYPEERVKNIIEEGNLAFKAWREESLDTRIELIQNLQTLLETDKEDLAKLAVQEMGKPYTQAISEVEKCAWLCEHYADHAAEYLDSDMIETDGQESWVTYEPLGLILAVMPWNFPYWQVMRFAVPTLLVGNTAILKHASNVPGCSKAIESLFKRAGFPKGVFSQVRIGGSRVKEVIDHPHVKAASLTGSEKAGKSLAAAAGEQLKKCVLELGGSNAFIVLKDAHLDSIMDTAVFARTQNNGQSCIAAKRFIVEAPIYDEFKNRLVEKFKELKMGDPMNEDTDIGPMARVDLAEELEEQMKKSIDAGAELICGGNRKDAMFEPTILAGVKPGMAAFDEETFGPLATLTKAESADDAIELANNTRFGLGASICTQNIDLAKILAQQIDDGAVFINELVKSDPRLPFGGTKISGYGRELGPLGIKEFVNAKTYYVK
ncbi:MAG TPA: NAD-dependent succinate-semialdehyde dehydrogenase [Cryomorphaceae bacterium]|nr:NAD-dependent succinate-semialdehyde dehydrogenase [Cryomorphaceae bacterium]